jgi:HD superfamily phosphohydrolase
MDAEDFRVWIDPMYGVVALDLFVADLLCQPELQRLRDVRLSNINSLLLAGGANISRFEHSVGTAILADRAARSLRLAETDHRALVCAAILHDVAIAPFGHLMEEGFRYAGKPFDHETRLQEIFLGAEIGNMERQIYRGRTAGFRGTFHKAPFKRLQLDVDRVFDIMQGKGELGPLVKGTLDLDNADNIPRMAHHIGIPFRKTLPIDIAEGFRITHKSVHFDAKSLDVLEEWQDLRRRLYNVLMTNPIDFSAKAMLIEAMRLALTGTEESPAILDQESWSLTDSELLGLLARYRPSMRLIERLELADYFDLVGLFWVDFGSQQSRVLQYGNATSLRADLASSLQVRTDELLIYWIPDKRARPLGHLIAETDVASPGANATKMNALSTKYLIGAVVGRKGFVNRLIEERCRDRIADMVGARSIERCDPQSHIAEAFRDAHSSSTEQRTLF